MLLVFTTPLNNKCIEKGVTWPSGSYFPKTIRSASILKKDGSKRVLGLPTLLERIAQQVVRVHLEKCLEPHFHQNSYGYRPGKSMHDAVSKAKFNCRQYPYVITLDIKSYFDKIPHDKFLPSNVSPRTCGVAEDVASMLSRKKFYGDGRCRI